MGQNPNRQPKAEVNEQMQSLAQMAGNLMLAEPEEAPAIPDEVYEEGEKLGWGAAN